MDILGLGTKREEGETARAESPEQKAKKGVPSQDV